MVYPRVPMLLASALLWLGLFPGPLRLAQAPPAAPLAEPAVRAKLRGLTGDLARAGEAELVARMDAALQALGDEEAELERARRGWEKSLASPRPPRLSRTALAARLRREIEPLVAALESAPEPQRGALARAVIQLDSDVPAANAALGLERTADGLWLSPEQRGWRKGGEVLENRIHAAEALRVDVATGASENPALLALGGPARCARAQGIELHGALPDETLARILRQALRAAALSRGILFDRLELPGGFPRRVMVLLDSAPLYARALEEARAGGGLSADDHAMTVSLGLRSYNDARGWRVDHATSEADMAAVILWSLLPEWLGRAAQPCLRVGHLNWLCLRFLGTSAPMMVWGESSGGSGAEERSHAKRSVIFPRQILWRSAQRNLWGTRAWMIAEAREGRDPPWARAMLDQDGKIRDAHLLKTTLVCEQLQCEGRLWEVVQATRSKTPPIPAFEKILGEDLDSFEERWKRWLDPPRREGVAQVLEAAGEASTASPFDAALRVLNEARADSLYEQRPEIQLVHLDPDLCRAAELHARYLVLNPSQKDAWPQIHEEYGGSPGFTAEGALSGANSVIALGRDPLGAVHAWLGTFYHRLPLLDPGLFGVGFGQAEDVVVLDVGSLRIEPYRDHVILWPLPEAEDVPLHFTPELPSPVPDANQERLGYPISVQLTFADGGGWPELQLELYKGGLESGERIEGYLVTPQAPFQTELVPRNAWGFLPSAPLARLTRYTAVARWGDEVRAWSFRTGK